MWRPQACRFISRLITAPQDSCAAYRDARIARSRLRGEVIVFVKE